MRSCRCPSAGTSRFPLLLLLRLFVLFVPAVCIAASSKAQDKLQEFSKVDIFGGYSYVHMVSTSQAGPIPELVTSFAPANLNGWNGSLEYKPIRWLGAVADFGGAYGTEQVTLGCEAIVPCPPPPFRATAHVHSVLFGPRLSVSIAKPRLSSKDSWA